MIRTGFGKNYVINLKRHTDRLKQTLEILGEQDTIVIEGYDNLDYRNNPQWLKENMSEKIVDPNGWWTLGIVCCALSHVKAWKAFLDSGESTALFFEDDIQLTEHYNPDLIEEIRDNIDGKDWGCVFLGKYENFIKLCDKSRNYYPLADTSVKWGHYKRFQKNGWAAHAYILNRKSAQWYLDRVKPVSKALDVFLEWSPFDIYAPRYSMFTQVKYAESHKEGYLPFLHLTEENKENAYSFTIEDGVVEEDFMIGEGFKLKEHTFKSFKLGKFRTHMPAYEMTFEL